MPISTFTYAAYKHLLDDIIDNGYIFANYHNHTEFPAPCILRHDIDNDVKKALKFARLEADSSVKSTYFILLNTNFYNVFSTSTKEMLKKIMVAGHEIGLHFDEMQYPPPPPSSSLIENIQKEIALLEQIIEYPVTTVSMHRPSQATLESNLAIPGVVNSYNQVFFKEFKYISDSRHHWRENAEGIISSKQYKKIHILTHPFWYTDNVESCRDKLFAFINAAKRERYDNMADNFRDLAEYVKREEI